MPKRLNRFCSIKTLRFCLLCLCGMVPALCLCGMVSALCLCGMLSALCLCEMVPAFCLCGMVPALFLYGMVPEGSWNTSLFVLLITSYVILERSNSRLMKLYDQ